MPRKLPTIDVNQARACAYRWHFLYRQAASQHPRRDEVAQLVNALPKVELNLLGHSALYGVSLSVIPTFSSLTRSRWDLWRIYSSVDNDYLSMEAFCHWYWTDAGWLEFEQAWGNLPEVVHMDVCTTGEVVHFCTQVEYIYPSEPKRR